MMGSTGMPPGLIAGPESAKKAFAAMMAALTSTCECEACGILRSMGRDLKAEMAR